MRVLWFLTIGWWTALAWLVLGAMLAVTIIGLPITVWCVKMAGLAAFGGKRQPEPAETITRIINEHHYFHHLPSGPKGGEPMPKPIKDERADEGEVLVLDRPVNDNVVPFRKRA